MEQKKIRIGFIGLNPNSQWAIQSHIPALKILADDFVVTGVANSTYESSKKAALALSIPNAFASPEDLFQSSEVDLVVVTVKVPYHYELVTAALQAGKHVYCEHPLGNGLEQTIKLTELAKTKNVIAVIGTQLSVQPQVLYLKELLENGYIGRILSTSIIGSGAVWGSHTASNGHYVNDRANGATMLTVPMGHMLAGLTTALGTVEDLSAKMLNNFTEVIISDTNETKHKTSEDQIMIIGKLSNGAALSIHYRGGLSRGTNFLWEINGTEGDIQITGPTGHAQLVPLVLKAAIGEVKELTLLKTPDRFFNSIPDDPLAGNVAQIYKRLANDIRNSTRTAPTFEDALNLYKLIDRVERSARK